MDNPLDKPAAKVGSGPPLEPKQKIRVLLVDDDPMIGRGLARNLSLMRVKMDLTVCTSAMEALRILERTFVDVIVTDLYMPGMDGSALLHEVRARYPTILRFVLSGEANPEIVLQATRVAHLYLAKPCETAALHKAIVETLAQMATIKNPQVAMTLSHLEGVPSLQNILVEFIHLLTDSGAS